MKADLFAQRDFSGGQVNNASRRRDDIDAVRTGAKTMRNWRIEATGQLVPRPGRRPIFVSGAKRSEPIRMGVTFEYLITFPPGQIVITDTHGVVVVTSTSPSVYLWRAATVAQIQWCQAVHQLVITFPGMRPQLAIWDQNTFQWSFSQLNYTLGSGQAFEAFYNFRQDGSTMGYSNVTGSITLTCSVDFFTQASVGATLSIGGQQVVVSAVTDARDATADVSYRLPDTITVPVVDGTKFQIGQVVSAITQNIKFEVSQIIGNSISGVMISPVLFDNTWVQKPNGTNADVLVSPYGSSPFTGAPTAGGFPLPTIRWAEEFMSSRRGWPQSCFYDRGRVGFCDFPQKPEAILWGAIDAPSGFWIDSAAAATQPEAGAAADSAILEFIPGQPGQGVPRVRHVIGWGDEFVFTDRGIYQIPISSSGNPLKPGSVEFREISNDGVAPIRPVPSQDVIVYMNAGLTRACVIRATGSYSRPYITQDMSDNHTDLFKSPVTFALAAGDGQVPERYIYMLNSDGSLVVGKFTADRTFVGWAPWSGAGSISWLSASGALVYFNANYGSDLVETEDATQFMDMSVLVNAPPAALVRAGLGPLWFRPSSTVTLMDGNLDMGERQTDALGNIVAIQGEDLTSPTLTAGLFAQPVFEPFVPNAQPGESVGQRQKRRKIKRAVVNVEKSSGFTFGNKTFPLTYFGEDGASQPVLRDGAFQIRPIGRSYDPTVTLTKDRPGPLRLCEISIEVTI